MQQVCIAYANGCPRSRMGAARLFPYFTANGWDVTQNFRKADMVVVSTCGVNKRAERKSIRLLSIADRNRKPNSKLVVLGCLAGINAEVLNHKFNATLVPPVGSAKLDQIIEAKVKLTETKEPNHVQPVVDKAQKCFSTFERVISEFEPSKVFLHRVFDYLKPNGITSFEENAFSIRILNGCLGECTYCAIKFAEGSLVSKPVDTILTEFDAGIDSKNEHFVVVGTDVGAYGQDIGTNIAELLRGLLARRGPYALHLQEFHPRWFIQYQKDLIRMFKAAGDKIADIIMPIQSGSERMLKLMRRVNTAAEAKECVLSLREASPRTRILTDVLVGFPGESETDFRDTVRFLRETQFDQIAVYKYEDRPKTEATQMPDKVPENVKHVRVYRLLREFDKTASVAL